MSGATFVRNCSCVHPSQDKIHGRNKRVMNACGGSRGKNHDRMRCTVCGHEIGLTQAEIKDVAGRGR